MPPPLDCTDYDFSLGEEVAFGPCTPQLQSSTLAPPQNLSSPEPCWRDLADQHQKALGDALEANSQVETLKPPACTVFCRILLRQLQGRLLDNVAVSTTLFLMCPLQLQETLTQRQEELVTLRESNMQLKELASQARQLAAVLDVSAAHHLACLPHGPACPWGTV